MRHDHHDHDEMYGELHNADFSRRHLIWAFGASALLLGCGGSGASAGLIASPQDGSLNPTKGNPTGPVTGSVDSGYRTPEGEVGPYFADDSASGFFRSNILPNIDGSSPQPGIPFTLHLYVYDGEAGLQPMQGVQVDIWHCNATGVYSDEADENTSGKTWLRGYQVTDAKGLVTFQTIFPGWYQGRCTHIHLRVRSKYNSASGLNDGSNTTQLFLPQALVNTINSTVPPYNSHGSNSTSNVGDHVYTQETHGKMEMSHVGDVTNGYTATFALYLPITVQ